ncbi:MAG: branched-chain amino acid transport system permease protein [Candidatus Eremiobacteraeota bacterium]|jgi:branched-chain amino acid transport system permease protein|nr:branched-chain amino acid transport system permease protein [Candidatus Eremiobacteraeota bacterium]MEA2720061.1 branched-chain amino acid transport system permease protein [Candidatus Eremiobacteraeota bacterium]
MTSTLLGSRRGAIVAAVILLIALVLPKLVYPVLAIDIVAYALFAVAFDLLLGFTGLLSFGHAIFWGGAGYVSTILIAKAHLPFPLAVLAALVYAALLALIVGAIAIRRQGIYFAMITLALAQLQYFFAYQLGDWTGGENGVQLSGRGNLFGIPLENDIAFYYAVLAVAALGTYLVVRVVRSPFGAVLNAMRENEQRAIALGFRVDRYKLIAFVLSGTLAGLAGVLFAVGNRLSGLDGVDWHTSGKVVMMSILGGIGTIFGPIVGAGIFESLDYFVSKTPIGDKTNIVMGTIFALCVLLFRRGIVGELLALRSKPREPR